MASPKGSGCLPRGTRCHPQGALCHLHRALGAIPMEVWVLSPRASGTIPVEVWVLSPRDSGRHPHRALLAIPTGPWVLWVPSPWPRSPCDAGGQASAGRALVPGAAYGVSAAFPPLPALSPCWVLGPSAVGPPLPVPLGDPKDLGDYASTHPGATPKGCQRCSLTQANNPGGGRAPLSPKQTPRWATYSDPEGHGGHLSLLRLPQDGSGYCPNYSSRLEEMPSAPADRWPLLMHDAPAGDGCARPPAAGLGPPPEPPEPLGEGRRDRAGFGEGSHSLFPSSGPGTLAQACAGHACPMQPVRAW